MEFATKVSKYLPITYASCVYKGVYIYIHTVHGYHVFICIYKYIHLNESLIIQVISGPKNKMSTKPSSSPSRPTQLRVSDGCPSNGFGPPEHRLETTKRWSDERRDASFLANRFALQAGI